MCLRFSPCRVGGAERTDILEHDIIGHADALLCAIHIGFSPDRMYGLPCCVGKRYGLMIPYLRLIGAVEGAPVGAGAAPEARADPLPGVAAVVLRVAGDYGELVRDYNYVVERYDATRKMCTDIGRNLGAGGSGVHRLHSYHPNFVLSFPPRAVSISRWKRCS